MVETGSAGKRHFSSPDFAREFTMIARWSGRAAALILLLIAAILMSPSASRAEPGVFADRILFGQSAAFDGPTAALGLGMRQGILAAVED